MLGMFLSKKNMLVKVNFLISSFLQKPLYRVKMLSTSVRVMKFCKHLRIERSLDGDCTGVSSGSKPVVRMKAGAPSVLLDRQSSDIFISKSQWYNGTRE